MRIDLIQIFVELIELPRFDKRNLRHADPVLAGDRAS